MPTVPKYEGNNSQLKFLHSSGQKIIRLIDSGDAVGVCELGRALSGNLQEKKITKGPSPKTVSNRVKKLVAWGLILEETDPEKIAEMDFKRKHDRKLTSKKVPEKRYVLTGDGKSLLETVRGFEDRPINEQLEAIKKQMQTFQEGGLTSADRDNLIALVEEIKERLERAEDAEPTLRTIFNIGSRLEKDGVQKWYDINELRSLLIALPAMDVPDGAKVQALRVLQIVLRSSIYDSRAMYQTNMLEESLKTLIDSSTGEPGLEAFLTVARMRDKNGRIADDQVDLFLAILWRCHSPHYEDRITQTEAVFRVARQWENVLTAPQKMKIRRSLNHLRARDAEIFMKNIDSGEHTDEDREIDTHRHRVTLAQLSSYI